MAKTRIVKPRVKRTSPLPPIYFEVSEMVVRGTFNGEKTASVKTFSPVRLRKGDSLQLTWNFNGLHFE